MKLDGSVLVGFGDFFSGEGEVGLTPPKGATPKGKKPLAMPKGLLHKIAVKHAKPTNNASPHRLAVGNAATAAAQAVAVSKHVAGQTLQYKNEVAAGMHRPMVSAAALHAAPSLASKVGASVPALARGHVLTPRQKAAVAKHARATVLLAKAKKNASIYAQKAGVAGTKGLAFVKKTVPQFPKTGPITIKAGSSHTTLHGILGYIDDVGGVENLSDEALVGIAAALGDVTPPPASTPPCTEDPNNPPDTSNPGLLMDGTTDPCYGTTGTGPTDTSGLPVDNSQGATGTGVVTAPDGTVLYDPSTDPEIVPMPVRGQTLSSADAQAVWAASVPEDGFVYQWATLPAYAVGSWSTFYSGSNINDDGYSPGIIWGYEFSGGDIGWMMSTDMNQASRFVDIHNVQKTADVASLAANKLGGAGALVGNPKGTVPNLQYSMADDKWFWQGQYAPVAMTASADAAITQANATTVATNRAAAVAVAKQMFADQATAAALLASTNATNAINEANATSAANVTATQQQSAQGDVETQAQQALVAQQQADTAEQVSETQADAQAAQVLIQQAQQQPQGGYADDGSGGDDGSGDDGGGYDSGDSTSTLEDASALSMDDSQQSDDDTLSDDSDFAE